MSRHDYGQVEIEVGGETLTLKPTLKAMQQIDRRCGSIRDAINQVRNLSLDAICFVLQSGAGIGQREAKELPQQVFEQGIVNVAAPLAEYLGLLLNPAGVESEEGDDSGKA